MKFEKLPTKQVITVDIDALIARLRQGPIILQSLDVRLYQALYRKSAHPSYKNVLLIDPQGHHIHAIELRLNPHYDDEILHEDQNI